MNRFPINASMTFAFFIAVSASGCAVNGDGAREIGFGRATIDQEQIERGRKQLRENAEKESAKAGISAVAAVDEKIGTIIIGEVGVLQRVDETAQLKLYEVHAKAQRELRKREPSLNLSTFNSKVAAVCSIEIFYIPGVMSRRGQAIIPADMIEKIDFPSYTKSSLFGSTGDLVAVKPGIDDLPLLDAVLCKKSDKNYDQCADRYAKGIFDMQTGQEVDSALKPKSNGARINPESYAKLL